jgi:hypothetical protein
VQIVTAGMGYGDDQPGRIPRGCLAREWETSLFLDGQCIEFRAQHDYRPRPVTHNSHESCLPDSRRHLEAKVFDTLRERFRSPLFMKRQLGVFVEVSIKGF